MSFLERNYLFLRRIHSLTGIAPIGVFLFPHLITNSSIVWGRMLKAPAHVLPGDVGHAGVETFQHEVNFIHSLPALVLMEIGLLFIPLLIHIGLGIYFAQTGKSNVNRYAYQANWRYTLQRLTGYIGVVYIVMHITSLRFGWEYFGLLPAFDPHHAASTTAAHFTESTLGPIVIAAFYLVGVLSLVFHFANGLWTAAITWGLTISVPAQQRWGYVCAAVGIMLAVAGTAAIVGFATLDHEQAAAIELQMMSVTVE